ncbi:hypothetical protein ABTM29_19280, partial [Acinetobacter baumannii]
MLQICEKGQLCLADHVSLAQAKRRGYVVFARESPRAMTTRLTLRLDFEDGRRLGHGKIALLEA